MSTGAIVGAAVRRAERRLVEHLREAGAVSASSARPIPDQSLIGGRVLHRLVNSGAVREAGAGYFLDEAAYSAFRSRRMRIMGLLVAPLAVGAVLVVWWVATR